MNTNIDTKFPDNPKQHPDGRPPLFINGERVYFDEPVMMEQPNPRRTYGTITNVEEGYYGCGYDYLYHVTWDSGSVNIFVDDKDYWGGSLQPITNIKQTLHWIIQEDIFREKGQKELCDLLMRFDIPHTFVKVIPFTQELDPEPVIDSRAIVMGSVGLTKIAMDRGWLPGAYYNDNFRFEEWIKHYGNHMLNADARVSRFDEVIFDAPELFIRPCEDLKKFNGRILSQEEFLVWQGLVNRSVTSSLGNVSNDTMVVVSSVKDIQQEYRFFVVDGKVVTGSRYKIGKRVAYDVNVDEEVFMYAQNIVDIWTPHIAFCLDIAKTADGYRVIEINCINSAGFYSANIQAIYEALAIL